LENGTEHEVLKNFPTEPELRSVLEGVATDARVDFLQYYWILNYTPGANS
jgi:demethylmenaquinone methyltransferase/2-methoxy-6-polyprenyl-1,4-benzoquinol methylase